MPLYEHTETTRRIVGMRCLVGFLGEKSQFSWWPTSFYDGASIRFLEPVFSRTAPIAQYNGTVEAARRFHDEHLNVGSFHLFRLPEEIEQDLHEAVQTEPPEFFALEKMHDRDTALDALWKSDADKPMSASGPILVGKTEAIRSSAVLDDISKIYRTALISDNRVFPYLAE